MSFTVLPLEKLSIHKINAESIYATYGDKWLYSDQTKKNVKLTSSWAPLYAKQVGLSSTQNIIENNLPITVAFQSGSSVEERVFTVIGSGEHLKDCNVIMGIRIHSMIFAMNLVDFQRIRGKEVKFIALTYDNAILVDGIEIIAIERRCSIYCTNIFGLALPIKIDESETVMIYNDVAFPYSAESVKIIEAGAGFIQANKKGLTMTFGHGEPLKIEPMITHPLLTCVTQYEKNVTKSLINILKTITLSQSKISDNKLESAKDSLMSILGELEYSS